MSYLKAAREAARQLPDRRLDAIGGRQRIRPRTLEDQQRHGLPLVEIAVGAVILGAELDAADIADARDPPVRVVPDDDVAELARVDEAPQCLDIQLKGAEARGRRLIEDARGDLDILRLERRDDLAGGQVARRDLVGIEPDPHRIIARAEDPHVADAVEPRQHVLHLKRRVVRDVELVARPVGRTEVDHHQHVGRVLLYRDAEPPHLFGQFRLGYRDAVLDEDLRDVEVGAEREGDGELQIAVGGRLAVHIEHVLDAVDFLLERRRHRIADDFGGSAGITGADDNRRRRDFRVLGDREGEIGRRADQNDKDRQDGRKDRPVDKEMRQVHRGSPLRAGRPSRSCPAAA